VRNVLPRHLVPGLSKLVGVSRQSCYFGERRIVSVLGHRDHQRDLAVVIDEDAADYGEMPMTICKPLAAFFVMLVIGLGSRTEAAEWQRFALPESAASVDVPVDLFTVDAGPPEKGKGRMFKTSDGSADLSIYELPNNGRSPAEFLRTRFKLPASAIIYRRVTSNMVTVSGFRGDKIWYARCNFMARELSCIGLNYLARDKSWWDPVVTRISHSLSGY